MMRLLGQELLHNVVRCEDGEKEEQKWNGADLSFGRCLRLLLGSSRMG